VALREKYRCVEPAYHMNKTYWNCIYITGEMSDAEEKLDLPFSGMSCEKITQKTAIRILWIN
jgi:hypothetical protein